MLALESGCSCYDNQLQNLAAGLVETEVLMNVVADVLKSWASTASSFFNQA